MNIVVQLMEVEKAEAIHDVVELILQDLNMEIDRALLTSQIW